MTPCAHPGCRLPGSTHATLHGRGAPETHWVCDAHAREIDGTDRCHCGERATAWGRCDAHQITGARAVAVAMVATAERVERAARVEPPSEVVQLPRRQKRGAPTRALLAARKLVRFTAADLTVEIGCARTHAPVLCAALLAEGVVEVVVPGRGNVGAVYRVVGAPERLDVHEGTIGSGRVDPTAPPLSPGVDLLNHTTPVRPVPWLRDLVEGVDEPPPAREPEVVGATLDALQVPLGSLDFRLGWLWAHVEGLRWRADFWGDR